MIYPKEKLFFICRLPAEFSYEKPTRYCEMNDGISFDKILPKQVGYFGTIIN
jgi:hypothetical protein